MKSTMESTMKAWLTYGFLHTKDFDEEGEELGSQSWEYGQSVEVISIVPPSITHKWDIFHEGMFTVRKDKQVECFDGSFIAFLNPNKEELN